MDEFMDASIFELAFGHIKELHELCASDDLSLTALQQKISLLDESDIQNISRVLYVEDLVNVYEIYEEFALAHTARLSASRIGLAWAPQSPWLHFVVRSYADYLWGLQSAVVVLIHLESLESHGLDGASYSFPIEGHA